MKSITIFERGINSIPVYAKINSRINNKLQEFLHECRDVLFKASSVFPFDLFPDAITVDKHKVNIISKEFFLSEGVHSIPIEMIKDIEVEVGPFFATLKIVPDGYPGNIPEIRYLKRQDALTARQIIQGLMVINKHNLESKLEGIDNDQLLTYVQSVGSSHVIE